MEEFIPIWIEVYNATKYCSTVICDWPWFEDFFRESFIEIYEPVFSRDIMNISLKQIWIEIRIQFHPNIAFHYHDCSMYYLDFESLIVMYLENDFASLFRAQENKYLTDRLGGKEASNPLFILPDFFLHFPNKLSYGYLRFEGIFPFPSNLS